MTNIQKDVPTSLANLLSYRLERLGEKVSQTVAVRILDEFGLALQQWYILLALYDLKDATATDLCLATALDKVTVSRAVSSLKRDERILSERDHQDRRKTHLSLSIAGQRTVEQVLPRVQVREAELKSALSDEELSALQDIMARLDRAAMPSG